MKKYFLVSQIALLLAVSLFLSGFLTVKEQQVRHVVVFKYKADATEKQIQQITDAFSKLKGKVPGIVSFEHGINDSPENKNQGFTHVYMVTFENAKARDNYLPHPEHKKFVDQLIGSGILEDLFVVDFSPTIKL